MGTGNGQHHGVDPPGVLFLQLLVRIVCFSSAAGILKSAVHVARSLLNLGAWNPACRLDLLVTLVRQQGLAR